MADETPQETPPQGEPATPPAAPAPEAAAPPAEAAPSESAADQKKPPLAVEVKVEDTGVCKKRLTVTIPREDIERRLQDRYTELEKEALVPGFRPGRAPRRLIEKRFHRAVSEEVGLALAADGLKQALEGQKLQVIGEPEFDAEAAAKIPDDGPLSFSVDLEVRPELTLPDYVGIPVAVERPAVTDKGVEEALDALRRRHATPRTLDETATAKEEDILTADLVIRVGEQKVIDRPDVRLPVDAIAVEGIPLEKFADLAAGAKVGETRSGDMPIGEACERQDLRGKTASVSVTVKEIARLEPPEDAVLAEQAGYESPEALRDGMRRQLEAEADEQYSRRQEAAVQDWLLNQVPLELPEDLAKRHADRVARRAMANLLYRGMPVDALRQRESEIRNVMGGQAARELKLFFILDAIAEKEKIEATDAEVDARIRLMAAQQGRKEDRLRLEMQERGTLESLEGQIREDKVVRLLLGKAKITEPPSAESAPAEPAASAEAAAPTPPGDAAARPAEGASEADKDVEST
jgi:trigger factor